jgi:hypothetical protein
VSSVWSRRPVQELRSGCGEQRVDFRAGEEGDDRAVGAFGGDGKYPGDQRGVLRVAVGGELEQRPHRGQSGVAGRGADAAVAFQMGKEGTDRCGVQVVEVQPGRRLAGAVGDVGQQQPEGVPVSRHGVRAGLPLADQVLREERLQGRRERGHDGRPTKASSRSPASSSNSGQADRYQ